MAIYRLPGAKTAQTLNQRACNPKMRVFIGLQTVITGHAGAHPHTRKKYFSLLFVHWLIVVVKTRQLL